MYILGLNSNIHSSAVSLIKDGKKIDEAFTDNYGDFKFDHLEENSGKYTLDILYKNDAPKVIELDLGTSINIGDIYL